MDDRDDADHYAALGVPRTATPDEVKRAFRVLARQLHPDLHPPEWDEAQRTRATEHLEAVLRAWDTLKDPERRARYDVHLREVEARREREARAAAQRLEWERARAAAEHERARRQAAASAEPPQPGADAADAALREAMERRAAYWAAVLGALTRPRRGADVYCAVELDERTWHSGERLHLAYSSEDVVVEPYAEPGWYVYPGRGAPGEFGGPPGDLHVAVQHGFRGSTVRVVRVSPGRSTARPAGPTAPHARPTAPPTASPTSPPTTSPPRTSPPPTPARAATPRAGARPAPRRRRRAARALLIGVLVWSVLTLAVAVGVGLVMVRLLNG